MTMPDHVKCGLCTHRVNLHTPVEGCTKCDCMAHPGEANRDRPGHVAAPVHYAVKSAPLTPSNQHSAEAIAAYPEPGYAAQTLRRQIAKERTAFDRGRAFVPVSTITDRETVARTGFATPERTAMIGAAVKSIERNFVNETQAWNVWNNLNTTPEFVAAILDLHAPPVPLASTREALRFALHTMGITEDGEQDADLLTDELFASGVLVDRGESDAQAEAEILMVLNGQQRPGDNDKEPAWFVYGKRMAGVIDNLNRAARLRSGKAEA